MDALAPVSLPPLPAVPPVPRSADTATPAPAVRPTSSYEAPPPPLEAPPPPLSVQREQLRPPSAPLMTSEQMTALLRAVLTGSAPTG